MEKAILPEMDGRRRREGGEDVRGGGGADGGFGAGGGTPTPEIMMSPVRLLRIRGYMEVEALRTFPWVMERWVEMVD